MKLPSNSKIATTKLDMFEIEIGNPKLTSLGKLEFEVSIVENSLVSGTTYQEFYATNSHDISVEDMNMLAFQIGAIMNGERTYAYLVGVAMGSYVFVKHGEDSPSKFLAEIKKNGFYAPDMIFDARLVDANVEEFDINETVFGVPVHMHREDFVYYETDNPHKRLVITYLGQLTSDKFVERKWVPQYMFYNPGSPMIEMLNNRVNRARRQSAKSGRYNPSRTTKRR
jgi:hypothetical protein